MSKDLSSILIIDENKSTQWMYGSNMHGDMKIVPALNLLDAEIALEKFGDSLDLIIVDSELGGKNTISLVSSIRQKVSCVIVATVNHSIEGKDFQEAGANYVLGKNTNVIKTILNLMPNLGRN